jgi:hypothetical protein
LDVHPTSGRVAAVIVATVAEVASEANATIRPYVSVKKPLSYVHFITELLVAAHDRQFREVAIAGVYEGRPCGAGMPPNRILGASHF